MASPITATPTTEHFEMPPYPVRRFSVAEYHRLGKAGVLTDDEKVELLEGWIVPQMIHNPPHDACVELVDQQIRPLLSKPWRLRVQSAITTEDSEPEPDLAIVTGDIREHVHRHPHPNEVGLLVEVADSSLARDRRKAESYGRAQIPVYWIVNLNDQCLEVYDQLQTEVGGSSFGRREVYGVDDSAPVVVGGQVVGEVNVRDLLP